MRIIYIILISILTIGCSTITAREDNGMGHPYISSELSIKNSGLNNLLALRLFVIPIIITLPLSIIDVAFGLVTDTVLVPFDLFIEPERDSRKIDLMLGMRL